MWPFRTRRRKYQAPPTTLNHTGLGSNQLQKVRRGKCTGCKVTLVRSFRLCRTGITQMIYFFTEPLEIELLE